MEKTVITVHALPSLVHQAPPTQPLIPDPVELTRMQPPLSLPSPIIVPAGKVKKPKVTKPKDSKPKPQKPPREPKRTKQKKIPIKEICARIRLDHNYCLQNPPEEATKPIKPKESQRKPIQFMFGPDEEPQRKTTPAPSSRLENLLKRHPAFSLPSNLNHHRNKAFPSYRDDDDVEIDVVTPPEPPQINYEPVRARHLMEECETYIKSTIINQAPDNWEAHVLKTGWTKTQRRLYKSVVSCFHLEHLARLSYQGNPSEPVLRRTCLDLTAQRVRQALNKICWDGKLTQWLNGIFMEHLSRDYLAIYLDVLQTLRGKLPHLVDKMVLLSTLAAQNKVKAAESLHDPDSPMSRSSPDSPQGMELKNILAAEGLTVLISRPWDPFMSVMHQQPHKANCDPIFIVVPHGPSWGNPINPKRYKAFINMISDLGRVHHVMMDPDMSNSYRLTVELFAEQMILESKSELNRIKSESPGRPIYLIGWGPGAIVAATVSLTEKVAGVVCLGFPLFGSFGKRGEPGDPLLQIKHPVLFVIGGRAANNSIALMEKFRKDLNLQKDAALVVIRCGDEYLCVGRQHRKTLLVTQSYVDKSIVDEIAKFVKATAPKISYINISNTVKMTEPSKTEFIHVPVIKPVRGNGMLPISTPNRSKVKPITDVEMAVEQAKNLVVTIPRLHIIEPTPPPPPGNGLVSMQPQPGPSKVTTATGTANSNPPAEEARTKLVKVVRTSDLKQYMSLGGDLSKLWADANMLFNPQNLPSNLPTPKDGLAVNTANAPRLPISFIDPQKPVMIIRPNSSAGAMTGTSSVRPGAPVPVSFPPRSATPVHTAGLPLPALVPFRPLSQDSTKVTSSSSTPEATVISTSEAPASNVIKLKPVRDMPDLIDRALVPAQTQKNGPVLDLITKVVNNDATTNSSDTKTKIFVRDWSADSAPSPSPSQVTGRKTVIRRPGGDRQINILQKPPNDPNQVPVLEKTSEQESVNVVTPVASVNPNSQESGPTRVRNSPVQESLESVILRPSEMETIKRMVTVTAAESAPVRDSVIEKRKLLITQEDAPVIAKKSKVTIVSDSEKVDKPSIVIRHPTTGTPSSTSKTLATASEKTAVKPKSQEHEATRAKQVVPRENSILAKQISENNEKLNAIQSKPKSQAEKASVSDAALVTAKKSLPPEIEATQMKLSSVEPILDGKTIRESSKNSINKDEIQVIAKKSKPTTVMPIMSESTVVKSTPKVSPLGPTLRKPAIDFKPKPKISFEEALTAVDKAKPAKATTSKLVRKSSGGSGSGSGDSGVNSGSASNGKTNSMNHNPPSTKKDVLVPKKIDGTKNNEADSSPAPVKPIKSAPAKSSIVNNKPQARTRRSELKSPTKPPEKIHNLRRDSAAQAFAVKNRVSPTQLKQKVSRTSDVARAERPQRSSFPKSKPVKNEDPAPPPPVRRSLPARYPAQQSNSRTRLEKAKKIRANIAKNVHSLRKRPKLTYVESPDTDTSITDPTSSSSSSSETEPEPPVAKPPKRVQKMAPAKSKREPVPVVTLDSDEDDENPRLTRSMRRQSTTTRGEIEEVPRKIPKPSGLIKCDLDEEEDEEEVEEEEDEESSQKKKLKPIFPCTPASLSSTRTRKVSIPKFYAYGM